MAKLPRTDRDASGGGAPEQLRRRARRLRDRADRVWGKYQLAHLHGDHEHGDRLEAWARRLEERADIREAQTWEPAVELAPLSLDERRRLRQIFGELVADRDREELARQARRAQNMDLPRGPAWYEAALENEADIVRAAPIGDRDNTLARSAWSLAKYVCSGELDEGDVLEALVPAAMSTGRSSRQAHITVRGVLRRRCQGRAA